MQSAPSSGDLVAIDARALRDLAERAKGGIVIHAPLWLLIGWTTGLAALAPAVFWMIGAVFAGVTLLRFALEQRLAAGAAERPARRLAFFALLLSNPLLWGLLVAAGRVWPVLEPSWNAIALATVGIASAGSMGLAIVRTVRHLYPALAVAPIALLWVFDPGAATPFSAGGVVLFLVYVGRASKAVQRDYWAAAHARLEIEARARQLERMSMTDALTRVHNRQFLDRQLEAEWRGPGRTIALLMIDVDHFKQINDTYGHAFGDACLQDVAHALQAALNRPGDLVARYGGEEFAVVLPGVGPEGALEIAERLHRSIGGIVRTFEGKRVRLSCSVGVHTTAVGDCSAAEALAHADRAMYAAKQRGRDRVVTSEASRSIDASAAASPARPLSPVRTVAAPT